MRRIAWTTDIHLNFLGTQQIETFLQSIKVTDPERLIISGDIGEAPSVYDYLRRIAETLAIPIYFVLGNHDFYHSRIQHVRVGITTLIQEVDNLYWLNAEEVIQLSADTALVGHDGWADGRYGNFHQSTVVLNDYVAIQDLAQLSDTTRLDMLNRLGDEAALHIRQVLGKACKIYERVFVVTHPPPFQQACWHEGKTATDDDPYLPHFTCKAIGDVLIDVALQFPKCELIVLCGHTHGSGEYRPLPNVQVITGGAEYGKPVINRMFLLE